MLSLAEIRKRITLSFNEDYNFIYNSCPAEVATKWELVELALDQLNEKERLLIELFYFQGYRDKDLLNHEWIGYSSIDSIKTQRYKCIGS